MKTLLTLVSIVLIPFLYISISFKDRSPVDRDTLTRLPNMETRSDLGVSNMVGVPNSWYDIVQRSISESEYRIQWQEKSRTWSSPNRAHDLRFYYESDGFRVVPRNNPTDWSVVLKLSQYGKSNLNEYRGSLVHAENNRARVEADGLAITYENSRSGMRQNFIIAERLSGDGLVKLFIEVESDLNCAVDPDGLGITFSDQYGVARFSYAGLNVFDAGGQELLAGIHKETGRIVIVVDDTNAEYPVLIDPLCTTPQWTVNGQQLNEYCGYVVAAAGDVNGDEFSDVMVAATHYDNDQTNEGRVFVYHGGSSGLDTTAAWIHEGNQDEVYFGTAMAPAGDVNGDGYSDVIIGSPYYDHGQTDEGSVFLFYGGPFGLSDTANWSAESDQTDALFGSSMAGAGDVNGDGYSDVIIGSIHFQNGQWHEGRAFLYRGSSTGLSPTPDWITESDQANAGLGSAVASAGDVNGDGYSDVMVAAFTYSYSQVYEGVVFVFHGGPSGLSPTYDWFAQGGQAHAYYGTSIASAGDVNGDGYSDVIVGAPNYDNSAVDCGLAFVYFGSASGLSSYWDWVADPYQGSAVFGFKAASAGDVNGDGYADVIVGAEYYDNGEIDEGAAFVFYGSGTGLRYTPGSFEPDWQVEGNQVNAVFSHSLAPVGDVNGDGFSDIIVAGIFYDGSWNAYGRACVYHGGVSGLSTIQHWQSQNNQPSSDFGFSVASGGDVNGDGFSDIIIGAPLYDNGQTDEGRAFLFYGSSEGVSLSPDWTTEGDQACALFGQCVTSTGDVNGDGYADVAVGACAFDNGQDDEGVVFLFYGGPSGLSASADWTAEGDQAGASFGYFVATAGDVNGDGYADLIIGAPGFDNGQNDEGAVVAYFGSYAGLSTTPGWVGESNQLSARYGSAGGTAGDVNGDGYSDIIVGAPYFDAGQLNEGSVFAYYGGMTGPGAAPNWTSESDQVNALFGSSVSTAGDVNGDGYSDVVIGSPQFDNGQNNEGRALVHAGSPVGLVGTPAWTHDINQSDAYFGQSVATAGDVNGDGYSDVIIGAPYFDGGQVDEGTAFVYQGSPSGLSLFPDWTAGPSQSSAMFGGCVASAGDVNADGYSEVVVGSCRFDNAGTDVGASFVYSGNSASGLSVRARQYRSDLATPIAPLGRTYSNSLAAVGIFVRPFYGAMKAQVEYEVKPMGVPFSGTDLRYSSWTFTGTGQEIKHLFAGLSAQTSYKWRARINFNIAEGALQHHSRWMYPEGNGGLGEADFRVTNLAPEPAVQASALTLDQQSNHGNHGILATWWSGDGSERIVVVSDVGPISVWPKDGVSYSPDSVYGHGSEIAPGEFVVYTGAASSLTVTGVGIRRTYSFAVFEFNGSGGDENYLVTHGIANTDSLTILNQVPSLAIGVPDTVVSEDHEEIFIRCLETVFEDDTVLAFASSALSPGVTPRLLNDSLFIVPEPDFAGIVPICVSAFDGELSCSDTFLVTVLSENDPPSVSNLIAPDNYSRYVTNPTSTAPVEFTWNSSIDPDGQSVRHVLWSDTGISFREPLALYEGPDTVFVAEIRQLDTLVMQLGIGQGDSIELYWRVLSISGMDTVPSSDTLQTRIIRQVVNDIDNESSKMPIRWALHQNCPNPFNPVTTIRYDLLHDSKVTLRIYNLLGQEVRTLVNHRESAGFKSTVWNGRDNAGRSVSSGVYWYRLQTREFTRTRKLLLMK